MENNMNNLKIFIRQAVSGDLNKILDFQLKMAEETEGLLLPPEKLRPGIEAALNDKNKGLYFMAETKGEIAGSLMITREWSDWRNAWVAWIQSVYVRPEFRRKGIYSALYRHVKALVEKGEYAGIRLYVDKTNTAAQKTYSALGMNGEHYRLFEWMKEY